VVPDHSRSHRPLQKLSLSFNFLLLATKNSVW
jgi:hypothetical protein